MAYILIFEDDGAPSFFNKNGTFRKAMGVDYYKSTEWRLDPAVKGYPSEEQDYSNGVIEERKTILMEEEQKA